MYPALRALGRFKVETDPNFHPQGMGTIEYFDRDTPQITYPEGEVYPHPARGRKPAVLVNPQYNDAQNVALDLLHGMTDADPKYRELRSSLASSLNEDDMKYFYEKDREEGYGMDGYERWKENYIDGKIRNLLFEGSKEDFERNRYYEKEREEMEGRNPQGYKAFLDLKEYLVNDRP